MSTKTFASYFKDLNEFSSASEIEHVKPEEVVKATIGSFESRDVSGYELYKHWASSLFKIFGAAKIKKCNLDGLLNVFSRANEEVFSECLETISDAQNDKLLAILKCTMELFTWIRSVAEEFATHEITAFLSFGLSLVNSFLVVLARHATLVYVNEILKRSLEVHNLILDILSNNEKTISLDDTNDFTSIIIHLCTIGELTTKRDIQTSVDTWKGVIRLILQNVPHTRSNGYTFGEGDWLKRPMSFLVNEICRNVQTVYKKNSIREPIQQVEKYLKVTQFYLKLLQTLATNFSHIPFPVYVDFLNTMAVILTPPDYIQQTPVQLLVTKYVINEIREGLLHFAYKNDKFYEYLLSPDFENNNSSRGFCEIAMEVIEVTTIIRNEFEYLKPSICIAALDRFPKNLHLFLNRRLYNRFIETLSLVPLHYHSIEFEKQLVQSVLQDDAVLALAAIDIFCTVSRVSMYAARLSYFKFWRDVNDNFVDLSNRLPALYVEILLINLYKDLGTHTKFEIWDNFRLDKIDTNRFELVIGLGSIPNTSLRQTTIKHFTEEVLRLVKVPPNGMKVDNLYTLIKYLKVLSPLPIGNDKLHDMLLRHLEIAMKHEKLTILAHTIIEFLSPRLGSEHIIKVLSVLDMSIGEATFNNQTIKLCSLALVQRHIINPRITKYCQNLLKFCEADDLIKHFGNNWKNGNPEVSSKISPELFMEILKNRTVGNSKTKHVCANQIDVPVSKKFKSNVNDVLESLERNVDKLESFARLEKLSTLDLEIIQRVVNQLQRIGANY